MSQFYDIKLEEELKLTLKAQLEDVALDEVAAKRLLKRVLEAPAPPSAQKGYFERNKRTFLSAAACAVLVIGIMAVGVRGGFGPQAPAAQPRTGMLGAPPSAAPVEAESAPVTDPAAAPAVQDAGSAPEAQGAVVQDAVAPEKQSAAVQGTAAPEAQGAAPKTGGGAEANQGPNPTQSGAASQEQDETALQQPEAGALQADSPAADAPSPALFQIAGDEGEPVAEEEAVEEAVDECVEEPLSPRAAGLYGSVGAEHAQPGFVPWSLVLQSVELCPDGAIQGLYEGEEGRLEVWLGGALAKDVCPGGGSVTFREFKGRYESRGDMSTLALDTEEGCLVLTLKGGTDIDRREMLAQVAGSIPMLD